MRYSQLERAMLADLLAGIGPDAPTLCEGWNTRDLAIHLVIRDRHPVATLAMAVPALAGAEAKVKSQLAKLPWIDLVELIRRPVGWNPMNLAPIDAKVNLVEYFVHHEDIRRARSDTPRALDNGEQFALWTSLRPLARVKFRRAGVGVAFEVPGGIRWQVKADPIRPTVVLSGPPSELVLYTTGRGAHAQVEITGPESARAVLARLRLAL